MKSFIALCICLLTVLFAQAQIINPKETAKRKVEDRTNSRSDQGIDKGLDKVEEGLKGIFKKKDKKKKKTQQTDAEKEADEENQDPSGENGKSSTQQPKPGFQSYSKFDFIPGEKILAVEDFSKDAVGDFPLQWNTSSGGEVVQISGFAGNWFKFPQNGVCFPEYINELPENFTMEFDMTINQETMSNNQSGLKVFFNQLIQNRTSFDHMFDPKAKVGLDIHPSGVEGGGDLYVWVIDQSEQPLLDTHQEINGNWLSDQPNHISIWRQGTRIRFYLNEKKIFDLPRAFQAGTKYGFLFATNLWGDGLYVTNIKIAASTPNNRGELIEKGRFSTTGILFDVNADRIKPSSFPVLKEIADVLRSNPSIQVRIVGHTDSDGDAAANQSLSERRATAVKNSLSKEFGIDAARMQTAGKGETEPVASNDNTQGKAQNRRVEFIRL